MFCREEVGDLVAHWAKPENQLGGVELIVVVKEVLGVQELRKLTKFSGRIFLDEPMALFKALGRR